MCRFIDIVTLVTQLICAARAREREREWQARNSPRMHNNTHFILSDQIVELAIIYIIIERTWTECIFVCVYTHFLLLSYTLCPSHLACQHLNGYHTLLLLLWVHDSPPSLIFTEKKSIFIQTHTQNQSN